MADATALEVAGAVLLVTQASKIGPHGAAINNLSTNYSYIISISYPRRKTEGDESQMKMKLSEEIWFTVKKQAPYFTCQLLLAINIAYLEQKALDRGGSITVKIYPITESESDPAIKTPWRRVL